MIVVAVAVAASSFTMQFVCKCKYNQQCTHIHTHIKRSFCQTLSQMQMHTDTVAATFTSTVTSEGNVISIMAHRP